MATGHGIWLEHGDIYALGALEGEELKQFETHLASGCAICAAHVRETRESLMLLHGSLELMTPSPAVKTRIYARLNQMVGQPLQRSRGCHVYGGAWESAPYRRLCCFS
jgi:anti-sigma-K factor RskA